MIDVNVQFVHFILETRAGTIDSTPVATRGTMRQQSSATAASSSAYSRYAPRHIPQPTRPSPQEPAQASLRAKWGQ